jgi:hypothetical protein
MRSYPSWIAGLNYRAPDGTDRGSYCARRKAGDLLTLTPEPDNAHDTDAVALHHEGHHVGYVPARHAWVRRSIAEGDTHRCTVTDVQIEAGRAARVGVEIAIVADGHPSDDSGYVDQSLSATPERRSSIETVHVGSRLHIAPPLQKPAARKRRNTIWYLLTVFGFASTVFGLPYAGARYRGHEGRIAYAASAQKTFEASDSQIVVKAGGLWYRELQIASPGMTKARADAFKGSIPAGLSGLGFEALVLSDRKTAWRYDLR